MPRKLKDRPKKVCKLVSCNKTFGQYRPNQAFCSGVCKNKWHSAERVRLTQLGKQAEGSQ